MKIGYEISFTRHFYKPEPMRPLSEIMADIKALEQESEGLLAEIVNNATGRKVVRLLILRAVFRIMYSCAIEWSHRGQSQLIGRCVKSSIQ